MTVKYGIAILLVLTILTGCSNYTDSAIASIKLDCLHPIEEDQCENKYFEDTQDILVMEEAIKRAILIERKGILDYFGEYNMEIKFISNTTKSYQLSLGTDRSTSGLLVDLSNSSQGYEIPIKYANKVRDLLNQ